MTTCNEKFWTENISTLFTSDNCGINFIPSMEMSLEQKMNASTRLLLIIFLIVLLFDVKLSIMFLLPFVVMIIILYYYQKMKPSRVNLPQQTRENYTSNSNKPLSAQNFRVKYNNENIFLKDDKVVVNSPSIYRFCDDEVPLGVNNPNYTSANQRLAGQPNPKTKIPPVMVPPCVDLDYWRANNLVTLSYVNSQTQEDGYQSGFQVTTCCGNVANDYIDPKPVRKRGHYTKNHHKQPVKENFETPLRQNEGGVDMACGYDPSQIFSSNLPSNLKSCELSRDPRMREYNDNLFTQTIEPNIYFKNEVNEPTNANMGISFTQQFEPTTCFLDGDSTHITAHDPLIIEPIFHDDDDEKKISVNESNIYDPRFSGSGTSYRSYIDRMTGQPRFVYNDVDAIRMPNYITRSNIDFLPFADSYGPLPSNGAYGNEFNDKIRALANDAFTRNSVEHRTDLQQRLMRKVNSQAWQQRVAPIRTSGQYMSGGMSCH